MGFHDFSEIMLFEVLVPTGFRLGIRMRIRIASELHQNGVLQGQFASEWPQNGYQNWYQK